MTERDDTWDLMVYNGEAAFCYECGRAWYPALDDEEDICPSCRDAVRQEGE